jgi:hypothetical protein
MRLKQHRQSEAQILTIGEIDWIMTKTFAGPHRQARELKAARKWVLMLLHQHPIAVSSNSPPISPSGELCESWSLLNEALAVAGRRVFIGRRSVFQTLCAASSVLVLAVQSSWLRTDLGGFFSAIDRRGISRVLGRSYAHPADVWDSLIGPYQFLGAK